MIKNYINAVIKSENMHQVHDECTLYIYDRAEISWHKNFIHVYLETSFEDEDIFIGADLTSYACINTYCNGSADRHGTMKLDGCGMDIYRGILHKHVDLRRVEIDYDYNINLSDAMLGIKSGKKPIPVDVLKAIIHIQSVARKEYGDG